MPEFDTFVSSAGGGFYDAAGDFAYGVFVQKATVALDNVEFIHNYAHIHTRSDALVLARGCTFEGSTEYDWSDGGTSNNTLYTDTAVATLTKASQIAAVQYSSQAPRDLFLQADDSRFTALRKVCPPHRAETLCAPQLHLQTQTMCVGLRQLPTRHGRHDIV